MEGERIAEARDRIAAQRGELRGWRPLVVGEVAVTALQVLGMVRGESGMVGMRAVVAARGAEAFAAHGLEVAERLLRARAVLREDDPFEVESVGEWHEGDGTAASYLAWPWRWLVFHVPERQLPAIAGLASDIVPAP
jgi:hypothetical protein